MIHPLRFEEPPGLLKGFRKPLLLDSAGDELAVVFNAGGEFLRTEFPEAQDPLGGQERPGGLGRGEAAFVMPRELALEMDFSVTIQGVFGGQVWLEISARFLKPREGGTHPFFSRLRLQDVPCPGSFESSLCSAVRRRLAAALPGYFAGKSFLKRDWSDRELQEHLHQAVGATSESDGFSVRSVRIVGVESSSGEQFLRELQDSQRILLEAATAEQLAAELRKLAMAKVCGENELKAVQAKTPAPLARIETDRQNARPCRLQPGGSAPEKAPMLAHWRLYDAVPGSWDIRRLNPVWRPLPNYGFIRHGESVQLELESRSPGFFYVLSLGPYARREAIHSRWEWLYANNNQNSIGYRFGRSLGNRLSVREKLVLPAGGEVADPEDAVWSFNRNSGREIIYVLFSPTPLSNDSLGAAIQTHPSRIDGARGFESHLRRTGVAGRNVSLDPREKDNRNEGGGRFENLVGPQGCCLEFVFHHL